MSGFYWNEVVAITLNNQQRAGDTVNKVGIQFDFSKKLPDLGQIARRIIQYHYFYVPIIRSHYHC